MDQKCFIWTTELTEEMLKLRIEYDWLFKKKKQAWREFHKILLCKGFPKEMTVKNLRKRWTYSYDCYRIAKRTGNKKWKHYKLFYKYLCKSKVLDKYESWSDEWRIKLIESITEAKQQQSDSHSVWVSVEKSLKLQNLPINCCIHDIKGLWEHIKMTFNRKHRLVLKKGAELTGWRLYVPMLDYFNKCDPEYFSNLENETPSEFFRREILSKRHRKRMPKNNDEKTEEFLWSRDITETFIQIRLQHEWLFRQRKQAWSDFRNILVQEYGFPKKLTTSDIRRKWTSTFSGYQKAVATNTNSWVYFNLFKIYHNESKQLDPISGWQDEWVFRLIKARTDMESLFRVHCKDLPLAWREVEKHLRSMNIPQEYILLDLPDVWMYLYKTFKWKKKFSNKGLLNEMWPYYAAMTQYFDVKQRYEEWKVEIPNENHYDDGMLDDEVVDEDNLKLNELKQRLKPKVEVIEASLCRTCCAEAACVSLFDETDEEGIDLASKLRAISGVKVEKSDSLPSQICFDCLRELENAHGFRKKCQEADKNLREKFTPDNKIKVEVTIDQYPFETLAADIDEMNTETAGADDAASDPGNRSEAEPTNVPHKKIQTKKEKAVARKKKTKKKYLYHKICEVCGKHTSNLSGHLDTHSSDKTYSCDLCDKKFKFRSGLLLHKSGHDPTPKKTCEVCGKTFHVLSQYRKHFVYHANERKYECETCKKRFNTLDILRVHRRIHTDERPFRCEECGKTFRTAGCVSRHKRIVHRKAIKHQ